MIRSRFALALTAILLTTACEPPNRVAPPEDRYPEEDVEDTAPEPDVATPAPPPRRASALPAPAPPAWRSGGSMAVTGQHVLVADASDDRLVVVQRDTQEVTSVALEGAPEQVVALGDGFAYVSLHRAGAVVKIDIASKTQVGRAVVGAGPWGLAADERTRRIYVSATFEGELLALEMESLRVTSVVTGLNQPRALAVGDGFLVATLHGRSAVRVSLQDGELGPEQRRVPLRTSSPQAQAAVASSRLPVEEEGRPGLALAATIHPISGMPLVAHQWSYTGTTESAAAAPPTNFYYSTAGGVGFQSGVTHEGSRDMSSSTDGSRGVDASFLLPRGMAHHPTTHVLAVAGYASDSVQFYDTSSPDPHSAALGTLKVGAAPKAVAFSPDGVSLFVFNEQGGSIYEFTMLHLDAGFQHQRLGPLTPSRVVVFGDGGRWLRARRAFTSSVTGRERWACVNCHFEGLSDGHTWIGINGIRQTPVLAGRLDGTAPYNWKGSEATLAGNINRTLGNLGGSLPAEDVSILATWLMQLPGPPRATLQGEGDAEAGRRVFADRTVGCANCHSGAALTDGLVHDVDSLSDEEYALEATLFDRGLRASSDFAALDTPSLIGLRYSGPYLHDGSAESLEDVLDGPMQPRRPLDPVERRDLLAYLRSL